MNFNDFKFDLNETFDKVILNEFKKSYEAVLIKRKLRWETIMKEGVIPPFNVQTKRFVRKGIPNEYRAQMWFEYSGAKKNAMKEPGAYEKLKNETITGPNEVVINADIPRTFPENELFRDIKHPQTLLPHLKRILTAFVVKNPTIGYCQGMNFLAGTILLVMMPDEEKAFWVFNTLVTNILQSYYISGMVRVQVDCMVLDELLKSKLPHVYECITHKCGASSIILSTKWFLCAFTDVLPIHTVLRVLDCVMCEGDKILFRAALAIIRLNSGAIEQCQSLAELMTLFKDILKSKSILYCHEFCECMFTMIGSMSQKTVNQYRISSEARLTSKN